MYVLTVITSIQKIRDNVPKKEVITHIWLWLEILRMRVSHRLH